MDEWYKTKFVDFNQASTKHAENVRHYRGDMASCKRSVSGAGKALELICHFMWSLYHDFTSIGNVTVLSAPIWVVSVGAWDF